MITLANIRRAIRNICRRLDILETKGKSVYEVAVESGFEGTVDEWLDSLKGEEGKSAYEVYAKSLISIADDVLIIDHTNFAEARHTKLEAYYSHYPLVAQGDGETWPPYRVKAFPYLYVGYEFDGHTTIKAYYKKELKLTWKPSAQIKTQDINGQDTGILVDRTYGIISLPDDLGLTEFTESSKGNKILADIKDFKIELVKDELLSEETWLASLKGDKGDQGIQGPKGDTGDAFNIYREYTSASLMNDDKDNVPVGKFVIINSDVEDPDNSKLFIRTNNLLDYPTGFKFLTDLSGALGIRGPQGILGIQGEQGNPGINGITPHIDQTTGNWFIGETNTNVHAEGPQGPSVQSDWNQSDNTLLDYIKNKPQVYTKSEIDSKFINHDFVEIGGIKWATMNVGANSITDGGLYFQWGDTQGYTAALVGTGSGQKLFDWSNYKYNESGSNNPSSSDMSKYNAIDEKTVLDASDDAATAAWGNSWRMPTNEEFGALINAANIVWINNYNSSGVAGVVCTDKTDNTKVLFFPAAGYCYGGNITDNNSIGGYWSSSLNNNYTSSYNFIINPYTSILNYLNRYYGRSIRAVVNDSNVKMPTLSDVAYSGDYNDLNNKPTIPLIWRGTQVQYDALSPNYDANTIYIIT